MTSDLIISQERLCEYMRLSTGNDKLMLGEWSCSSLGWKGSNNVTGGLYRVEGTAYEKDKSVRWSMILKVVLPSPNADEPSHYSYWKREVLAYQSGLLDKLTQMIRAPRCFGVEEKTDKTVWIWLEEVSDYTQGKWSQTQYEETARLLGRFNGTYLNDESLPTDSWLCKRWLLSWVEECDKYDDKAALYEVPKIVKQTSKSTLDEKLVRNSQVAIHLLQLAEEASSLLPYIFENVG